MTRPPVTRVFTNEFEHTAQARCECGWSGLLHEPWRPSADAWPETVRSAEDDAVRHRSDKGHPIPAQHVVAVA